MNKLNSEFDSDKHHGGKFQVGREIGITEGRGLILDSMARKDLREKVMLV